MNKEVLIVLGSPNSPSGVLSDLSLSRLDYHLERVTLIFKEILKNYEITFVGVECNLDKEKLDALLMHEKTAIESILKNGLYY